MGSGRLQPPLVVRLLGRLAEDDVVFVGIFHRRDPAKDLPAADEDTVVVQRNTSSLLVEFDGEQELIGLDSFDALLDELSSDTFT